MGSGGTAGTTHYELLNVAPDASPAEIKRAYHDLARRYHPDARPFADQAGADQARRIMAALNEAWAVLGDPPRRRAYDSQLGFHAQEHEPSGWMPLEPEPGDEFDPLLEEDYEAPPAGPADLIVLVPVAVLVLAVAAFVLSVLSQSSFWMWVSIVLLPIAGVTFVATPLAVMLIRVRARSRT